MSDNNYYITKIVVTVASQGRLVGPDGHNLSLMDVAHEITEGECSGDVVYESERMVEPEEIARELERQGSDPAFLLGDDWNSSYDPREEALTPSQRNEGYGDWL